MSAAPKRQKLDQQRRKKVPASFMRMNTRGFLATCNFREKECVKECYNLLNSYYESPDSKGTSDGLGQDPKNSDEEEEDISTQLENQIQASKIKAKERVFHAVDTQVQNCVFIEASIEDPLSLGVRIVRDIAEHKLASTRFLLRLIPVEIVCRANLVDMMQTAEKLFDKHFLAEPKTYAIIFNRRHNNDIKRETVIKEFADIIQAKNQNKVDLSAPQLAVVVEVIKGFCCLSVVPDYYALKKYNLVELCGGGNTKKTKPPAEEETATATSSPVDDGNCDENKPK